MGFFSFLGGKSPEEIELAGDKFLKAGEYGVAKLEYEKAAQKAQSRFPEKESLIARLHQKITDAKEFLATAHIANSQELMAAGNDKDALDLLHLALELTGEDQKKEAIQNLIHAHAANSGQAAHRKEPAGMASSDLDEGDELDDDYFFVLINALPEDIRAAYQGYSPAFRQGYVALNNGDFETAATQLSLAMSLPEPDQPLIPLELATALVHLDQHDRARHLLETFISKNSEDIRAYQTLCDIYWMTEDFDAAMNLIENCPAQIRDTFPIKMLLGETFYQMGQYSAAKDLFAALEKTAGENELVSRALARAWEAIGETETARDIYARILNGCARCGVRLDPFIRQRYAELCFACGERSERLLNLYLSIIQDDPDNKESHYERVYELYTALGEQAEAARYKRLMD